MLRIKVTSDMGKVIDQLSRKPEDISRGLISAVRGEAIRLQAHIVRDYLSGQALHRRSGRLSRSIKANLNEEFFYEGGRVVGMSTTVGTNVEYAAYHEFGFHGTENVRAYVRRVKSRNVKARGKIIAEGIAHVRAHTRKVNYPGHPFMRPALEDLKPIMRENIREAIDKAFRGGE